MNPSVVSSRSRQAIWLKWDWSWPPSGVFGGSGSCAICTEQAQRSSQPGSRRVERRKRRTTNLELVVHQHAALHLESDVRRVRHDEEEGFERVCSWRWRAREEGGEGAARVVGGDDGREEGEHFLGGDWRSEGTGVSK